MIKRVSILFLCLASLGVNAQRLKEAEKFLFKQKYTEAKSVLNKVLADSNTYCKYKPYFVKGEVYLNEFQSKIKGVTYEDVNILNVDIALEAYQTALHLADTNGHPFEIHIGIQNCGIHYNNKGIEEYKAQNLDTALYFIEKSIAIDASQNKIDTNKITNCFAIASSLENGSKVEQYGLLLVDSLKSNDANIYGMLIQHYVKQDSTKQIGEEYLQKSIEKFPANENFKALEYNLALNETDVRKKVARLNDIFLRDSTNSNLATDIANIYLEIEEDEESIKYYKKAIELDSTNIYAHKYIGTLYYNQAISLHNLSVEIYNGLAIDKFKLLKSNEADLLFRKALPYFLKAHKLKYNDKDTLESLKNIYGMLDGYETELKEVELLLTN